MVLSEQELRDRWKTLDGQERQKGIVRALKEKDSPWVILEGFPGVKEIENGKDLRGVYLKYSHLEGADFNRAHIEGADLSLTHIEGADFQQSFLDGTQLFDCQVDCLTDFRSSNLDNAWCDHKTKNRLKYNIRRLNWEDWYKEHSLFKWPVKSFWRLTNYGTDQKSLIGSFLITGLLFTGFYVAFPDAISGLLSVDNVVDMPSSFETIHLGLLGDFDVPVNYEPVRISQAVPGWLIPFRAFYFSIVTMTTLGFGDMYAEPMNLLGHILLTFQVLMGYLFLGALITRLGILFQSEGPTDIKKDRKPEEEAEGGES